MNCVEVFVYVQKNFFLSAVLSSHTVHIFIYMYTVITFSIKPTMPSKKRGEEEEEEKKESEDIERSIGRTTVLP